MILHVIYLFSIVSILTLGFVIYSGSWLIKKLEYFQVLTYKPMPIQIKEYRAVDLKATFQYIREESIYTRPIFIKNHISHVIIDEDHKRHIIG